MDNTIDKALLKEALALYEDRWLSSISEQGFTPSKQFEKKMTKLCKSQSSVYHRMTLTKARKAAAILVAALVLLASMLSVGAIRETILSFFINRGAEVNVLEYNTENSDNSPTRIEKVYAPDYLPKGYELKTENNSEESVLRVYMRGESYITLEQFTQNSYKSASDAELSEIEKETHNGQQYIVRGYENALTFVWEKDGYVFEMVGFESKAEMLKVASSVAAER